MKSIGDERYDLHAHVRNFGIKDFGAAFAVAGD